MPPTDQELTPLRPHVDPDRWEALVGSIMKAAEPELARRRRERDVLELISGWTRPVLSAAAVMVMISATLLALVWDGEGDVVTLDEGVPLLAETVVPSGLVSWLEEEAAPSLLEFVEALEEGGYR